MRKITTPIWSRFTQATLALAFLLAGAGSAAAAEFVAESEEHIPSCFEVPCGSDYAEYLRLEGVSQRLQEKITVGNARISAEEAKISSALSHVPGGCNPPGVWVATCAAIDQLREQVSGTVSSLRESVASLQEKKILANRVRICLRWVRQIQCRQGQSN